MTLSKETYQALSTGHPIVPLANDRERQKDLVVYTTSFSILLCVFLTLNKNNLNPTQPEPTAEVSSQFIIPTIYLNLQEDGLPSNQELSRIAYNKGLINSQSTSNIRDSHRNSTVVRLIFTNGKVVVFDHNDLHIGEIRTDGTIQQIQRYIVTSN